MKKFAVLSLALILSINILSISAFAKPLEKSNSNNEVIAIVDGIEITKDDVDENGLINNEVFLRKKPIESDKIDERYSVPGTLYVPKGRNALMIKKLQAPQFVQQTDTYFLNPNSADSYAHRLTSSSNLSIIGSGIIGITLGYVTSSPHVGAIYTVATMLSGLRMNSVKSAILNHSNKGRSVEVKVIRSNQTPMSIYYVNSWNGTSINTNITSSGGVRENLHFYKTN